jgi:hypothetical protein
MNLSILEKITLIALDDNTGIWVTDSMRLNYALSCGILFELYEAGEIDLKNGTIELTNSKSTNNLLLENTLELLSNLKNKSLISVVYKVAKLASKSKNKILDDLVEKGILETKVQNGTTIYPMIDGSYENAIKDELIEIAHKYKTIEEKDNLFLLKILANCKLQQEVFKNEMDTKKLVEIVENAKIGSNINNKTSRVVNELEDTLSNLVVSASTIKVY